MIASKMHVPRHPATRPPEGMRPVLVEPFHVPFKLSLKRLLEVITLLEATRAKADVESLILAHPSYQLQLALVLCAILAFTVLFVPIPTKFLVCGPILPLTFNALITRRHGDAIARTIGAYCNKRSLYTLNICVVSRRELFRLCHKFCSGGDLS